MDGKGNQNRWSQQKFSPFVGKTLTAGAATTTEKTSRNQLLNQCTIRTTSMKDGSNTRRRSSPQREIQEKRSEQAEEEREQQRQPPDADTDSVTGDLQNNNGLSRGLKILLPRPSSNLSTSSGRSGKSRHSHGSTSRRSHRSSSVGHRSHRGHHQHHEHSTKERNKALKPRSSSESKNKRRSSLKLGVRFQESLQEKNPDNMKDPHMSNERYQIGKPKPDSSMIKLSQSLYSSPFAAYKKSKDPLLQHITGVDDWVPFPHLGDSPGLTQTPKAKRRTSPGPVYFEHEDAYRRDRNDGELSCLESSSDEDDHSSTDNTTYLTEKSAHNPWCACLTRLDLSDVSSDEKEKSGSRRGKRGKEDDIRDDLDDNTEDGDDNTSADTSEMKREKDDFGYSEKLLNHFSYLSSTSPGVPTIYGTVDDDITISVPQLEQKRRSVRRGPPPRREGRGGETRPLRPPRSPRSQRRPREPDISDDLSLISSPVGINW